MEDNLLPPINLSNDINIPLVIDLDGSLCQSDTLHEAMVALAVEQPGSLIKGLPRLFDGKVAFKNHVASSVIVPAETLPYDPAVLALITEARQQGRRTILASASDHRQVEAVAAHLGLFDSAVGTGCADVEPGNLSGVRKAQYLVTQFGEKGFDYIGDSATDLPVWAASRMAFGVRASQGLTSRASKAGIALQPVSAKGGFPFRVLLEALRPHQWAKNVLILLPVLAAQQASALGAALLAMLCFSLAASGVYIFNDLVDIASDRAHPRKRRRPFASGRLAVSHGLVAGVILFAISLLLALFLMPPAFSVVLLVYVVATFAYSFWLKRKMMVDIVSLAGLYTIRIVAGGAATGIVLSPWLFVFSMFLFFSLATIKRQAELEDVMRAGGQRAAGRNLDAVDLPILQGMAIASSQAAVLVFALYVQDETVQQHYGRPDLLLLVCPVLFFWLSRMQLLTRRGFMTDDPLVFTMRDRVSLISGLVMFAIVLVAIVGG